MPPFRRTVTFKRPRRWFAPSAPSSGVTLTPSPATSTWVVPAVALVVGALTLTPAPATSTWSVPAPALSGALTLTPTPATRTWSVPGGTLSVAALTLSPSPATATWSVPGGTLSNNVTLTPAAATSSWVVPSPVLSIGALTLAPTPAHSAWSVPAAGIFSGVILTPSAAVRTWHVGGGVIGVTAITTSPIINSRGLYERRFDSIRSRNRPPIVRPESPVQEESGSVAAATTWQPTDNSGAGLVLAFDPDDCFFAQDGTLVRAYFRIVFPATASAAAVAISGLPLTARATPNAVAPVAIGYTNAGVTFVGVVRANDSYFSLFDTSGVAITNAQMSGKELRGCAIYEAAS